MGFSGGTAGVVASTVIVVALYVAVLVMFAVAWHRRYLVSSEATTVRAALRWRWRQTRFLLLSIVVGLIAGLIYIVGTLIGALIGALMVVAQGQSSVGGLSFFVLTVSAFALVLPGAKRGT